MTVLSDPTGVLDVRSALPDPPSSHPTFVGATRAVMVRALKHFARTPQLVVVEALTSAMFLLIFRYVFGGAIGTGSVSYADFLIPALAATSGLFASGAVGMASDIESGLCDRLRSLPIPRAAVLVGRSLADTLLVVWGAFTTVVLGFATGFRFHGSALDALASVGLIVLFGFACTWPLLWIGLVAGSSQAAQGMSFMTFPFIFVSSTYVPVESMPGWLQPIAREQPVTAMVGAIRSLAVGDAGRDVLGHSTGWFVLRAVVWSLVLVAVFGTLAVRAFRRS